MKGLDFHTDGAVEDFNTPKLPDAKGHTCQTCGDACDDHGETSWTEIHGIEFTCAACVAEAEHYRRCNCGVGEDDF